MISKNSKTAKKPLLKKKPLLTKTAKPALKKARPVKESNTIYLSNLSYNRDRQGVKNLVSRYGEVKNINLVIDLDTKVSKGMAFVELADIASAKLAIEGLNQQDIDGRTLKASFAIPQKPLTLKLKAEIDAEKELKAPKKTFFKPKNKTKKPTESGFVPRKKSLR
jgi:RNA recognition motif-containing protein